MTRPLAALIAGVTRYAYVYNNENCEWELTTLRDDGQYVRYDDILAALEAATPPDLMEAGKVLGKTVNTCIDLSDQNMGVEARAVGSAADTLRALIALATAQAAQIAGLKANVGYWTGEIDTVLAGRAAAEAESATLRAEVERLRGALEKINVGEGWAAKIAREALKEAGHEPT